ncbi:MAG: ATP-binding cassette domain-containing protein [Pseudomonadota bacterium]
MIILRDIALRRGPNLLLEDVELTLLPGQKLALTGANGTGKSSFFSFLLGDLQADRGEVDGLESLSVAHMAQDVPGSQQTAMEFVIEGDSTLAKLIKELERYEDAEDYESAAGVHARLEVANGYARQREAGLLMYRLGFASVDERRALADFSGGWRSRLALARALFAETDLLLLDEPTNHLDLDTTLWLQDFLRSYAGTVLLISHDRDFIDACCTQVLHVHGRRLDQYRGNYSDFERERSERLQLQQAEAKKLQKQRADIENFVRRFRAKATKAKQAQSRIKMLNRMGELAPVYASSPFSFNFPDPESCGDPVISLSKAAIGYAGQRALLENVELSIRQGDRIALLGKNGVGKTTLLRSLIGEQGLQAGDLFTAPKCRVGYFDQQQIDSLDLDASPILHLQRLRPQAREQEVRDFLGGFDFSGEKAERTVVLFSGGEKARLALAMIAWQKPNVLILDEPTNHLDIEMRSALELALASFAGSVVLVSHDRHLLRSSTETLLLLRGGQVEEFDGDLEDYQRLVLSSNIDVAPLKTSGVGDDKKLHSRRERRQADAKAREKLRPLQKECGLLEKKIDALNTELAELDTQLSDQAMYLDNAKDRLQAVLQRQGSLKTELQKSEELWLQKQSEIEKLASD